jgi:hypothetical protein
MENVVRKKPVLAGRPVRATPTQREEAEVAAALAAIGEADDPRLTEMAQAAGPMWTRMRRSRWLPGSAPRPLRGCPIRRRWNAGVGRLKDRRTRHGVARR